MKKLALFFVLIPFLALGQNQFPLIKDGGIWREARVAINHPPDPWWLIKQQYLMEGDTTVNANIYKKVYICDYSPSISNKVFFGGIREDSSGKVFIFLDTNQSIISNFNIQAGIEYLLYDFSLNIGDTIKINNERDSIQVLQSIDTVLVSNSYRKRWVFENTGQGLLGEIIEGIGSIAGLFYPLQYCFEESQLLTCYEETNLFWNNPYLQGLDCFSVSIDESKSHTKPALRIFPNPAQDFITIELSETLLQNAELKVYNALGQLVFEQQIAKGMLQVQISLKGFERGIYFFELKDESSVLASVKFVKE